MSSILIYRQHEQDALRALGFTWDEANKEWFSDKGCAGRASKSVHIESDIDFFIFALRETDDEGNESYESFTGIEQLTEYLK